MTAPIKNKKTPPKTPSLRTLFSQFQERTDLRGLKALSRDVVRGEGPKKEEAQQALTIHSRLAQSAGSHDVPAALSFTRLKLEEALREHQEAAEILESDLARTKKELETTEAKVTTAEGEARAANESLTQTTEALEQTKGDLDQKELELSTVQIQAENAERELKTLGDELSKADSRIKELSGQVEALNKSLAEASSSNSSELAAARDQAAEANSLLDRKNEENETLRGQIDKLTEDLAAETKSSEDLSAQLERTLALALGDTGYFSIEEAMRPIQNLLFGQRGNDSIDLSKLLPFLNVLADHVPEHGKQLYKAAESTLQKARLTPVQQTEEIIDAFVNYLSTKADNAVVAQMLYAFLPSN